MATIFEIKKYDVSYYAGAKNVRGYPYRAIIGLRDESDAFFCRCLLPSQSGNHAYG